MTGAFFTCAKLNEASFIGAVLGGVRHDEAAEFSFAYALFQALQHHEERGHEQDRESRGGYHAGQLANHEECAGW